jgi:hypothetical protein
MAEIDINKSAENEKGEGATSTSISTSSPTLTSLQQSASVVAALEKDSLVQY